ncbi:THA2 aldolase, partial [Mystacornis crossleyi]|nr:THA2 aldolase [Mystacornis crossleyi]
LMSAAVAQGVEPAQIAQHCDSVPLLLQGLLGLGALSGAVLAGCREFVTEAWRVRKLLGGGVLAAAARLGLQDTEVTPCRAHDNAQCFAEGTSGPLGIRVLDSPLWSINLAAEETNIVMGNVQGAWPSPAQLCDRPRAVSEEEVAETGQAVSVLLLPWSAQTVCALWHRSISARDTELTRRKLGFVARKCQE